MEKPILELAIGSHTVNKIFGPTANPYNHSLSAGGSSDKRAAAVSMNLVPCSDGSDMMGSCRIQRHLLISMAIDLHLASFQN